MAKPFLKWVGGKTKIVDKIVAAIEATGVDLSAPATRYREPFLGGGAVFFALRARHRRNFVATLTDANLELANVFREVRDAHAEVARIANSWPVAKDKYIDLCREFRGLGPQHKTWSAARTIFLNKTCFNGLFRVGPNGFNVPWGKAKETLVVADPIELEAAAQALAGAEIDGADFMNAGNARPGDVVYFDPPYLGAYNGYLGAFGWKQHEILRDLFFSLARSGVFVVLSNSDTPWVRDAYADARVHIIRAPRSVSRNGAGRESVSEIIAVAGPGIVAGEAPLPELKTILESKTAARTADEVRTALGLGLLVKVTWVDGLEQWAVHAGRHSPVSDTIFLGDHVFDSQEKIDKIRRGVLRNKL